MYTDVETTFDDTRGLNTVVSPSDDDRDDVDEKTWAYEATAKEFFRRERDLETNADDFMTVDNYDELVARRSGIDYYNLDSDDEETCFPADTLTDADERTAMTDMARQLEKRFLRRKSKVIDAEEEFSKVLWEKKTKPDRSVTQEQLDPAIVNMLKQSFLKGEMKNPALIRRYLQQVTQLLQQEKQNNTKYPQDAPELDSDPRLIDSVASQLQERVEQGKTHGLTVQTLEAASPRGAYVQDTNSVELNTERNLQRYAPISQSPISRFLAKALKSDEETSDEMYRRVFEQLSTDEQARVQPDTKKESSKHSTQVVIPAGPQRPMSPCEQAAELLFKTASQFSASPCSSPRHRLKPPRFQSRLVASHHNSLLQGDESSLDSERCDDSKASGIVPTEGALSKAVNNVCHDNSIPEVKATRSILEGRKSQAQSLLAVTSHKMGNLSIHTPQTNGVHMDAPQRPRSTLDPDAVHHEDVSRARSILEIVESLSKTTTESPCGALTELAHRATVEGTKSLLGEQMRSEASQLQTEEVTENKINGSDVINLVTDNDTRASFVESYNRFTATESIPGTATIDTRIKDTIVSREGDISVRAPATMSLAQRTIQSEMVSTSVRDTILPREGAVSVHAPSVLVRNNTTGESIESKVELTSNQALETVGSLTQILSHNMFSDNLDDADLQYARDYASLFDDFLVEYPEFMTKHAESTTLIQAIKLQRILENLADREVNAQKQLEKIASDKKQETDKYHTELVRANRDKASREIALQQEISMGKESIPILEENLRWQLLTENEHRARTEYAAKQAAWDVEYDPNNLLAAVPQSVETQSIRDAVAEAVDDSYESLLQYQVENTFLNTQVSVLEKKLLFHKNQSKDLLWVDHLLRRLDSSAMNRLEAQIKSSQVNVLS